MTPWRRVRDFPGVIAKDVPRFARALLRSGPAHADHPRGWKSLCNRTERLQADSEGSGMICDWQWGSEIHAAEVLPVLGRLVASAALAEWPVRFADSPLVVSETPIVSFIFAHSGMDRLPQLRRTIQSIHAQSEVPCECIVVDQSVQPIVSRIGSPVVYRHLSTKNIPRGWRKSWAYNVGSRLARGTVLVFHDGDVCAPAAYAREVARSILERGHASASLQRMLFYMSREDTEAVERSNEIKAFTPSLVFQNWKGGTIAISRDAFVSIGGFDEGFVDWGGEDDEFYDRCAALGHCRAGYLPFVHLWHQSQPDRKLDSNPNIVDVMPWRMGLSHQERIVELTRRRWGNAAMPDPRTGYKDQKQCA